MVIVAGCPRQSPEVMNAKTEKKERFWNQDDSKTWHPRPAPLPASSEPDQERKSGDRPKQRVQRGRSAPNRK